MTIVGITASRGRLLTYTAVSGSIEMLFNIIKSSLNDEVRGKFAPYEKVGAIRDLFRGEVARGKTLACGVGLPLDKADQALNIAFDTYENFGAVLPLLLSVRYVKGTQATLGFTKFATTCILELDSLNVPETRSYVRAVWAALEAAGINFTLHWGKYNTYLTGPRVERMYGTAAVNEWKASRATLMESADVSRVFDNSFTRTAGLGT